MGFRIAAENLAVVVARNTQTEHAEPLSVSVPLSVLVVSTAKMLRGYSRFRSILLI